MKIKLIKFFPAMQKSVLTALTTLLCIVLIESGICLFSPAMAVTTTGTLNITATINASCTITGATLTFPNYSGSAVTGNTTISVKCTNGTTYRVGLGTGLNSSSVTTRKMKSGSNLLAYSLLQSPGGANWGNTPGTDTPAASTGNGSTQTLTIYGSIAAGLTPPIGTYSDTVTATINY